MAEFAKEDLDAIVSAIGFGIVSDFRSLQSAMGTLADQSAENSRILGDINTNLTSTDRTLERLEKDIYRQIDARQFARVENEMEKKTKASSRRADQILTQVQKSLSDLQRETAKGNSQSSGGQSQSKESPQVSSDSEINQFLKDVESTGGSSGSSLSPVPSSGGGGGGGVSGLAMAGVAAAVVGTGYMLMNNQSSASVGQLAPAEAAVPSAPSIGVSENRGSATQTPTASTTGAISSATQTVTAATTSIRRKALEKITNKLYDWVNKNTDKVMAIIGQGNAKVLGQLTGGSFTFSKYMTDSSWTGLGEQYVLGNSISPAQTKDKNAAYVASVVVNLAILAYLACRDIYTRENYNDINSGAVQNFDDLGSSEKFQFIKNAGSQIENYVNKLISETKTSTTSNFSIISSAAAATPAPTESPGTAQSLTPTIAPPTTSGGDENEEDQSAEPQQSGGGAGGGTGGGGGGGGTTPSSAGAGSQQTSSPTQSFTGLKQSENQSDASTSGVDNIASIDTSSNVLGDISGSSSLEDLKNEIASGEGDYGSYNRGTAGDTPRSQRSIDIQDLTVSQVMQLQSQGQLFAVGKYQFIPGTLSEAVRSTGIDLNQKFDSSTQEQLFPYLISEAKRPKLASYLAGKSNNEDAAINDLAHEFASIPMTSGRGAYDGDRAGNKASGGLNRVQKIRSILRGIRNSSSSTTVAPDEVHAAAQGAIITPLPKTPTDTLNLAPPKMGSTSVSDDEDEFTTSSNPIDARPKSYSANPMDEMKNKISSYMNYMEYHFGYLSQEFDLHTSGELTAEEAYKRAMNPLGR
jgi:hypothetical protein